MLFNGVRESVPQDGAAEAGAGETSRSASSGGELTSKPAGAAAGPSLWLQATYSILFFPFIKIRSTQVHDDDRKTRTALLTVSNIWLAGG